MEWERKTSDSSCSPLFQEPGLGCWESIWREFLLETR